MALEAFKGSLKTVGEYDIVEKIAEGGMGTVYRGKHQQTGEIVAIKVVPSHMTSNQVLLKRFENEFRAASKLNHPNIVRALDYGTVSGRPYLVMEFVDGESLGRTGRRLDEEDQERHPAAAKAEPETLRAHRRRHPAGDERRRNQAAANLPGIRGRPQGCHDRSEPRAVVHGLPRRGRREAHGQR